MALITSTSKKWMIKKMLLTLTLLHLRLTKKKNLSNKQKSIRRTWKVKRQCLEASMKEKWSSKKKNKMKSIIRKWKIKEEILRTSFTRKISTRSTF